MESKQTSSCCKRGGSGHWLVASLLVASGVLLLARNMGWMTSELFDIVVSWQSLLIVLGFHAICSRRFFTGLILLIIGSGFMLSRLDCSWMPQDPSTIIWPVVLVLAGVIIVFKPRKKIRWQHWEEQFCSGSKQQCHTTDGFVNSDNTFSGVRQVVLDEIFKGAKIRTTFGGTSLDLRHTHIVSGETYIDVDCNWGGVEIFVPADWNVVIQCKAFMGACEDKRWPDPSVDRERTLVIRGNISFGGVEIKA